MVADNVPESIRILLPHQSYSRTTYSLRNNSYQIPKIHHEYARNSLWKTVLLVVIVLNVTLQTVSYVSVTILSIISNISYSL